MTFHEQLEGILDDHPSGTVSFEWVDGRMTATLQEGSLSIVGAGGNPEEALEDLAGEIGEEDSKQGNTKDCSPG